mgnify:CR=1 FL=1
MTNRPRPRVAIVDNSIDPAIYRPVEHWGRYLEAPWEAFLAREGRLPDPARFSHIILTGVQTLRDLMARDLKGREALLAALDQPPRDSGLIRRIVRAFLAAGPDLRETLDFT